MDVSISEDENDVLYISFLQNESYDNYVIIQYVEELDKQDIELDFTKYYLEIDERGGGYNCLEKVISERYFVTFIFNGKGKEIFKDESLKIYYHNLNSSRWDELKSVMSKVFSEISLVIKD